MPEPYDRDWPEHTHEVRPWAQKHRRGPREDRQFDEVTVSLPPRIAERDHAHMPGELWGPLDEAAATVSALDAQHGPRMSFLESFLLRSEAVSSSRIERHTAPLDDIARASIGAKAGEDARITVAAARSMARLVETAGSTRSIERKDLLAAHHALMKDDPRDAEEAGKFRTEQNWIGGSDYSPRGAVHVPPPHELVPGYMDDLVAYVNRSDVPTFVQAAVAHAQFESIHPFVDGNGRVGRSLINAILRRRRITQNAVVPIASAMVADTDTYFWHVNSYREGELWGFVEYLAASSRRAAKEARVSAERLARMPEEWREVVKPRKNSAAEALIDNLLDNPVIDSGIAESLAGTSSASSTMTAIEKLVESGVLHQVGESKRNRVWVATEIMDEIESLNTRLRELD